MGALTAKAVEQLVRRGKPGRHADGAGLFLEIKSSTSHYWVLRIQARSRRHEYGLGSGRKVSLALAREKATAHVQALMQGGDPASRGRIKPRTLTFKEAATECIAEHVKALTNDKVKKQWTKRLEVHVYPHIGSLPVESIETRDVMRALTPIWTAKPETARRMRQRIKKVLDWAKLHGHRSGDNPVDVIMNGKGLSAQTQLVRHHPALHYSKAGKFIGALRDGTAELSTKLAFEFLILTACRVQEVVKACWNEIDWEARTWTIPASRMKIKNKDHTVPLSDRALAILEEAKAFGSEYIFPSPNKVTKPLSTGAFDRRIDILGLTGKVTAHGFRSTFRDWAAEEMSFASEVVEMALAHAIKSEVEAAYRRGDLLSKRKTLMQSWDDYLAGRKSADNVTQFRRTRRLSPAKIPA